MKKTYFIWLGVQCIVWVFAVAYFPFTFQAERIAGLSLFFIILFILPLFREKPIIQAIFFCLQALLTVIIFYPVENALNPFVFLIHMLILAEAFFNLTMKINIIVIGIQLLSAIWLMQGANLDKTEFAWLFLFYLLVLMALIYYKKIYKRAQEIKMKNDAFIDEYRKMKRQLITEEEQVRQDERALIGHEIHDSVGHKLTALIMQLEAFRLQADEKDQERIITIKNLAEQSLEETRSAVRSFKQKEIGGLQGVMRLIRNLEMESFMKVHFSVKHGAFAAPLSGEQSFAIFRSVQEALTNIMKHSSSREAQVTFEAPGGSIFRFEVINKTTYNPHFQEGYGLKAMRERLEKVGGTLEVHHDARQFVVRGSIRL